jgi:RNA polymerase sigma-70 factor (ECF subfamily)
MKADEISFETMVGPLLRPGFELAVTMLGDPQAASDAVQNASINAWRKLAQVRDTSSTRPWFLAIVANECRALRRARWWSVLKGAEPRATSAIPDERIVRDADLKRALMQLRRADRLSLFLHFYLDLPIEEVAQVLGITISAARARVYRAVARLRPIVDAEEASS